MNSASPSRVSLPPSSGSSLFGRDRELCILRTNLAATIAGRGHLVLISGEAGIGKTTLINRLCHEAAEAHAHVFVGHCYDRTETPPYGPWSECFAPSLTDDHGREKAMIAPPSLSTVLSQDAFFAQVREFVATLAMERPLILVLEDLHWADTASLDLLRFLARNVQTLPILLIVTYRDDELHRHHPLAAIIPLLIREASAQRLNLRPLALQAADALVRARYGVSDDEAGQLATYLIERTEGNALFMTELLRTLEEEQLLRREGETWHVGSIAHAPLPRLLQQMIDARLTRLGDTADALLAIAAVIGHEVPFSIWQAVTQSDEETLDATIERAEAVHLVSAWASGEGFRFTHALIREALYEGVSATRRRRLHRQIGEVLAASPSPSPDAVAYHFQQARDEKAVPWLARAGEQAEDAFARRMAAERYEAAHDLLRAHFGNAEEAGWFQLRAALLRRYEDADRAAVRVTETREIAGAGNHLRLVAYARIVYGYTLALAGKFGVALHEVQTGLDALDTLPPADATQQAHEIRFAAYLDRGPLVVWLAFVGRFAEARALGEHLLGDTPTTPTDASEASRQAPVWSALAYVYIMQGDLPRAWHTDMIACRVHDATHPRRLVIPRIRGAFVREVLACVVDDPQMRAQKVAEGDGVPPRGKWTQNAEVRVNYAHYLRLPLLVIEGHWQEASELAAQLVAANRTYSVENPRRIALGAIARARGEGPQAWQFVHEAFPHGSETEPGAMHFSFALSMQRLAIELALDSGDLVTARAWLEAHTRWFDWSGVVLGRAYVQVLQARYHRLAGSPPQAEADAQAALTAATTLRQPLVLLAAHRLLGELATEAGHRAAARDHLDTALALADACRAPYERALILLAQAELAVVLGDATLATIALAEVRAICVPLDARPALNRADALAVRLIAGEPTPPTHPGGLSLREIEVLRLVANGLTNAQVAEHLFLSPRTVNGHLTAIYTKLGVPSRAGAIRFALDHDLR